MNGIEVGKDVVCIETHPHKIVIKNNIYHVYGIKKSCCSVRLDVGIKADYTHDGCLTCNNRTPNIDGIWWINIRRFAPLADISELEELLKEQPKEIQQ